MVIQMNDSRRRVVAFQGEPGAYSEQALQKYFSEREVEPEGHPCDSLEEVIEKVENGVARSGIIPVENSIGGYVDGAYRLLAGGNVSAIGEVYLRVRHCLLGLSGADVDEIEVVYSHPQALKQCRDVLRELGVETHATYDTAGSAKMVKEREKRRIAAIASKFAGEKYGLEALLEDIQSSRNNYTRFLLISTGAVDSRNPGIDYKTSITFHLGDSPGSLYDCLEPFATNNINLTMIQSRPTQSGDWGYHFDMELEGHPDEEAVGTAIEGLRALVPDVQLLGSYPRGEKS